MIDSNSLLAAKFFIAEKWDKVKTKTALFIARRVLPKSLVYWVLIYVWADVTTNEMSNVNAGDVTLGDTIRIWGDRK
jgi:hypothetical protein